MHWRKAKRDGEFVPSKNKTIEEKLEQYAVDENGCWVWTAGYFQSGYGNVWWNGSPHNAHRVAYIVLGGNEVPEGLHVDHLCRNRACINPLHLEAVTSRENNMRGDSPCAVNSRKTECVNGHEFTEENTYARPNGRECKACIRIRTAVFRADRRAGREAGTQ